MARTIIIFYAILILLPGCGNNSEQDSGFSKSNVYTEGVFCRIEKINNNLYNLYLKISGDSCIAFKTMIPIGEAEISRLSKKGINIKIYYNEYRNNTTKTTDKIIKSIEPVYEVENR